MPAALEVEYAADARTVALGQLQGRRVCQSIWDFDTLLPPASAPVSLGEGWTPLVAAPRAAPGWARDVRVLVKLEGCNPSGAFKDRLNSVAVSVARAFGFSRVLCTTTGNHGVSLAAYAAAAGMECLVACSPGAEAAAVSRCGSTAPT